MTPTSKKTIRINDIDIAYTLSGDLNSFRPWVTLSHSLACNADMWAAQVPVLAEKYRVLCFDTRGHGQSSAPAGPYTLDGLAADVHGLLAALGIQRTHWVGVSMGGMIAQAFVLAYPGILQSMVIADSTSRRPPNAEAMWGERIAAAQANGMAAIVDGTLARWFTDPYRAAQPEVMAQFGQMIATTPVNGYAGCCAAIAQIDYLDRLPEITCPALVAVGEHDHGTPPEMSRQMHAKLTQSEFLLISDAAHIASTEQADVFNAALLAFLAKHA